MDGGDGRRVFCRRILGGWRIGKRDEIMMEENVLKGVYVGDSK